MPALYYERTTPDEQRRHLERLSTLAEGDGLRIDPFQGEDGGWNVEIVTMDWDEPGLLDRIFEALLRCINIPEGIAIRRARIFTGRDGRVVNLLELATRSGGLVNRQACDQVMAELAKIEPGERGGLESIEHMPFTKSIPLVTTYPTIDNDRSDAYTFLALRVEKVSNRFASVLLHFLARSELWLNIQMAEIRQEPEGVYEFYVVDKYGQKLRDTPYLRLSLVRVLEAMNHMLMTFNVNYVSRDWHGRIDRNEHTIYHSRPNPDDFGRDLENIRQMAQIKGMGRKLSALVQHGLLAHDHYYFIKKVESFVDAHRERIKAMVEAPPRPEDIALCREYFTLRHQALRIMAPLFEKMVVMPEVAPSLSDAARLEALCRPSPPGPYALNPQNELYPTASMWLGEPINVLDAFFLTARTDCYIHHDFLDGMEAALAGFTPAYAEDHRGEVGARFLELLDETVRQGNMATVLRNLRSVGLLSRYLPGFEDIQGMVHVVADHGYTVDEHSLIVVEVLEGLRLLGEVLPRPGRLTMRSEYEQLANAVELQKFARKYVIEMRMLQGVTELRRNPAIKPFFHLMESVRSTSLEYLVELNFLEQGHATCMGALTEIERIRLQLEPLVRLYRGLPFSEQRTLLLSGLLHDLKKPAQDHGPLMAAEMAAYLAGLGISLPEREVARIAWLIHHHLDIRPLMNRMGRKGEQALREFQEQAGDPTLVGALILFTYADRVAVYQDQNKNGHDAMVLSAMLSQLESPGAPLEM